MRIGVPSEHGQIERRVALTPDAVARLLPLGVEVLVQAGAGIAAALPDGDYTEAGARIVAGRRRAAGRGRPDGDGDATARAGRAGLPVGHRPGRHAAAAGQPRAGRRADHGRRHVVQPGRHPPHHPLAVDGRAVLAGNGVRLQGGADVGGAAAQVLPDADDGRRHRGAGQGVRARRRRGRPAGDRDGPPAGRRRLGLRHATGGARAGREPGRQLRGAAAGCRGGRGRPRLRPGADPRPSTPSSRSWSLARWPTPTWSSPRP